MSNYLSDFEITHDSPKSQRLVFLLLPTPMARDRRPEVMESIQGMPDQSVESLLHILSFGGLGLSGNQIMERLLDMESADFEAMISLMNRHIDDAVEIYLTHTISPTHIDLMDSLFWYSQDEPLTEVQEKNFLWATAAVHQRNNDWDFSTLTDLDYEASVVGMAKDGTPMLSNRTPIITDGDLLSLCRSSSSDYRRLNKTISQNARIHVDRIKAILNSDVQRVLTDGVL